jgi:hypothetical protein
LYLVRNCHRKIFLPGSAVDVIKKLDLVSIRSSNRIQEGRVLRYPGTGRLDPDSIRFLDPCPDPDSQSGSGSWRAKITHKNRKKLTNLIFLSAGCSLLRAEGFSSSLDVLYGGLGIGKLQFLISKRKKVLSALNFQFLVIESKTLDPDWIGSGSG